MKLSVRETGYSVKKLCLNVERNSDEGYTVSKRDDLGLMTGRHQQRFGHEANVPSSIIVFDYPEVTGQFNK